MTEHRSSTDDEDSFQSHKRRFFDDARMTILLIAIVGFLSSGMVWTIFHQLDNKVDKEQHNKDIAAISEKIDNKFDTIIRLLNQHEAETRNRRGE